MRIPFDLIAVVIFSEGIAKLLLENITRTQEAQLVAELSQIRASTVLVLWLGYILVAWLLNELLTRHIEWRTRFGEHASGLPGTRHPQRIYNLGSRGVMLLTVGLFAFNMWALKWPLWVQSWPAWFGMSPDAAVGGLILGESKVALMLLTLLPFLLGMAAGWIPRRRLAASRGRRPIPLLKFLSYEARLSLVPLILWLLLALIADAGACLPKAATDWLAVPGVDTLLMLAMILFLSVVALPQLVIWWWQCAPLPEGELKTRLLALMECSNVKARAIMVWGPKGSGLLNAAVLGPWASFRYVLISPALVDELGMEETEAVLAHELGHARHGHLTLLFILLLCMSAILLPLAEMIPVGSPLEQSGLIVLAIILYIWGVFGTIMRQCEREADLASAELMGTPAPIVTALEKLARISGDTRHVYTWHHGSIANRVESVLKLSADPLRGARFHLHLKWLRITLIGVTALAIGWQLAAQFSPGKG
jgi:Zn-dependent protease with chaperone function